MPRLARDDLPAGLEDLLRAALSSDPSRRPQSAAELAGGLAACGARTSSGRGGPSRPAAPPVAPTGAGPGPADDALAARAEQVASGLAASGVTDAASTHAVGSGCPDTPASAGLPAPGQRPTSLTGAAPGAAQADLTHRRGDLEALGAGLPAAAPAAAPAPAAPAAAPGAAAPAHRSPSRRPRGVVALLLAVAVVAVLGTGAGVVWGVLRGGGGEPLVDPTVTGTSTIPPDAAESAPRGLTVRAAEGRLELSWTLPDETMTPIVRSEPAVGDMQSMNPDRPA